MEIYILYYDIVMLMTNELEVTTKCYAIIDRVAGPAGNSARVHIPKAWVGKKVRVLLLDPLEEMVDKK